MTAITWSLTADFDRNGTYETDLTGYVAHPGSGLRISRGIGRDGKPLTSKLSVGLLNTSGDFSPHNTSSAFYGLLQPGVPMRVTATHNAVNYTLWTGYAMSWRTTWAGGGLSGCQVECDDIFAILRDADPVNVTASTARDTDGALVAIMDALSLVAGDRNFDDGVQDLAMHFCVGDNPLDAMMYVTASEMGGLLYPDATGRLRFEARNSRLGTTVDDTWGDGTTIIPVGVDYNLNANEVVTSVTARATRFRTGQTETVVFTVSENMFTRPTANSHALTAGEIYERTFQTDSATYGSLVTPDAGYDYTANSAIDGTGTDKTSALTVTVTELGGGRFRLKWVNTDAATIYVTKFQLRGTPVQFLADRPMAEFSLSQSGLKAGRGIQFDIPFSGDTGAKLRDYAYQELRVGRYPWPLLMLAFRPGDDTARASLLGAELGDLIAYSDAALASNLAPQVDDLWYVEALEYSIPPDWAGQTFDLKVTLSPSYVYRNLDALAFDTFARANVSGALGTTFNGYTWANDTGFDISSNAARANTDTLSIPDVTLGVSDQVVEVQLANIGTGDEAGVVLRKTDANNYYRAYVDKGSNEVILEKVVASVVTELSSPALTVGSSHEIRAMIQGSRIRVDVDRIRYIDVTDSALATGTKCGLMARNANATTTFKNFYSEGL